MIKEDSIRHTLSFLENELVDQIMEFSTIETIPTETVLIREGQYLKHLPVVIDGMVKVYSQFDDKELLLYYIKPRQSCIISFAAASYNEPSKICAITETKSKLLLMPTDKIPGWKTQFPRFNQLFFDLYHLRYLDLLDTINQLVFNKLDQRIMVYLKELSHQTDSDLISVRHHKIAKDLGTAREVITRSIRKLENENKVLQTAEGIKILY